MANKKLFNNKQSTPKADTVNSAGGKAYKLENRHALVQYAMTGCLNDTFYGNAELQLEQVLKLCENIEPEFIAKTAIYAREKGYMKDMPALLVTALAVMSKDSSEAQNVLPNTFKSVINNPKMVRNFVQMIRSNLSVGEQSRSSFGALPKRLVKEYIEGLDDEQLLHFSVGNTPSMKDIFKLVHPCPKNKTRENFHAYLLGYDQHVQKSKLPKIVKDLESFRNGDLETPPKVNFQLLTSSELNTKAWTAIAKTAPWHMTRMNLNTFQRHGVFDNPKMVTLVAERLRDAEAIKKSKVFPYQLLSAFTAAEDVPSEIREALQDALEIAVENVPNYEGKTVYLFPDVSGSMSSAVTGNRGSATSVVRCIDIAGLVAATVLRNNKNGRVIPFEQSVCNVSLNPRDSVMTNANKLARIGGGGTNCSAPLAKLNAENAKGDLIIYISDNESWVDSGRYSSFGHYGSTGTMAEWKKFKTRNPHAKLVCIDIQANGTSQAKESKDILNIGGFSDSVFDVINSFVSGDIGTNHWVGEVEQVEI